MLIDWFTVAAQAINFLILVWLLKRFLYRPILDAIDAREQHIAQTLADAEDKENQAQQEKTLFAQKNSEFEEQRSALLETATTAANSESQRLLAEAKLTADALAVQRQESLLQQQKALSTALNQKTQQEVLAISRQVLTDLSDTKLEEQILTRFLTQLSALDKASKETLFCTRSTNEQALRIRSAFPLLDEQKKRISDAVQQCSTRDLAINFEIDKEIIAGIELTINGQKLAWSIAQYSDSLEKHLQQLLQQAPTQQIITEAP